MTTTIAGLLVFAVCFIAIGTIVGAAGYGWFSQSQRQAVSERERALRDEWDSLYRAQELNAAFWDARTAMRTMAREDLAAGAEATAP